MLLKRLSFFWKGISRERSGFREMSADMGNLPSNLEVQSEAPYNVMPTVCREQRNCQSISRGILGPHILSPNKT